MEIQLKENLNIFNTILNIASNINNESIITFDKNGIYLRLIDMSNVMLVNVFIDKKFFEEYKIEKVNSFNIDFGILYKVLKSFKKTVVIKDLDNELEFTNENMKRAIKKYVAVKDERETPNIEYDYKTTIDWEEFIEQVKTLNEASPILLLEVGEDMKLSSKGNLERIEIKNKLKQTGSKQKVYFSMDYLLKLEKLSEIINEIEINIGSDKPLLIKGEAENVKVSCLIAPRMAGDDA